MTADKIVRSPCAICSTTLTQPAAMAPVATRMSTAAMAPAVLITNAV